MSTFSDKLAKARAASPQTTDVDIALDTTSIEEIQQLEQQLRSIDTRYEISFAKLRDELTEWAREDRLVDPRIAQQQTIIDKLQDARVEELATVQKQLDAVSQSAADALVTLRFTRVPGQEWAALCALHPPRAEVGLDLKYGYNYQAVGEAAARTSGQYIDGDEATDLSPAEWDELLALASGHEFERICSALFSLNEWGPEQAVRVLGKASRDAASRKSDSPSPSASPLAASPAGKRKSTGRSSSTTDAQPA